MMRNKTGILALVLAGIASWTVVGFAAAEHDVPPEGFKLTDWQETHMPPTLAVRRAQVKPPACGVLRLRPTFNACGVAWGSQKEVPGLKLEYRAVGAADWKTATTPQWFYETQDYRASILRLSENAAFECRLIAGDRTLASGSFRTWSSDVPVAKTIELDPATLAYPVKINVKGTPAGWIRYTTKPGTVLGGKDVWTRLLDLTGAEYVLIEGITFQGGGGWPDVPVWIGDCRAVRIRNCEFHGWGRVGPPSFDGTPKGGWGGGKYLDEKASKPGRPRYINYDCALRVGRGASEIVIERCYAHDPRGRANSWFYSHPAGPEAVLMDYPEHSCVIRYNDFVGSDNHRWNDAVEGAGNFYADGGFNQDADVYGNFMIYCNDDNIEIDGGQQNVRVFDNRFEGALSGVSIQGCCASPVYVFDNLFSGMVEEFGFANPSIKTSTFSPWWYAPYAGVWGNVYQDAGDFCPKQGASARWDIHDNVRDPSPSAATLAKYPVRPLGFTLSTGRLAGIKAAAGVAAPATAEVILASTCDRDVPFTVRQNFDADWFTVRPASGVVKAGGEVKLVVTFDGTKMNARHVYRSAFLVRTPCGLSRAVSVLGEATDFTLPEKPVPPSETTQYVAVADPAAQTAEGVFRVTKPGRYWFFIRAQGRSRARLDALVSIDGAPEKRMTATIYGGYPTWTMVRPGKSGAFSGITVAFDLAAGEHRLVVTRMPKADFALTGMALTDDPAAFEPR